MNLDPLHERFPETHQVLVRNLGKVLEACRLFAGPVTRFDPSAEGPTRFDQYLDFAMSIYADKFLQLYEAVAESLLSERYLIYAQSARSILENAATLRYYARTPEMSQFRASLAPTIEMASAALANLDKLIRGNRFSWGAFLEGRPDELRAEADHEHLSQTHVQTCLKHWFRESPDMKSLYDLLCDMVHPNLGSNLLVLRGDSGSLVAGGTGGRPMAVHLVYPTLSGINGTFKMIQHSFQELDATRPKPGAA